MQCPKEVRYNADRKGGIALNSKIIFMGTPQIAATVLEHLLEAKANVVLAVTQPDKKVGRKGTVQACEVKKLAQEHGIPVFQPTKIRTDYQPILDAKADLVITCAYGQIVPQAVLEAPKHGCVNLHGSLLPKYRGAAPIQRALWQGERVSGMSLMRMEVGMDTGGVAAQATLNLEPNETTTTLFDKMGHLAGNLIVDNLDALLAGELEFIAQDHDQATYAAKISKEEEEIDLSKDDEQIDRQIRALAQVPGGYVSTSIGKLKLLSVRYEPGQTPGIGVFGKQGKKQFVMGGHKGLFLLDEVQPEGKNPMKSADFINGKGRSLLGQKVGDYK